jgi:hypothetical protein
MHELFGAKVPKHKNKLKEQGGGSKLMSFKFFKWSALAKEGSRQPLSFKERG